MQFRPFLSQANLKDWASPVLMLMVVPLLRILPRNPAIAVVELAADLDVLEHAESGITQLLRLRLSLFRLRNQQTRYGTPGNSGTSKKLH